MVAQRYDDDTPKRGEPAPDYPGRDEVMPLREAPYGERAENPFVSEPPKLLLAQEGAATRLIQRQWYELGPRVGEIVHYVSYGTPGGEYTKECRAAVVTEVTQNPDADGTVGLCVLNPTGQFFNRSVPHAEDLRAAQESPKGANCADREYHGNPHRYCSCGWTEPEHPGGTWHWPETRDGA